MLLPQFADAFLVELLSVYQYPGVEFADGDGAGDFAEHELVADQVQEGAGFAGGHDEDEL